MKILNTNVNVFSTERDILLYRQMSYYLQKLWQRSLHCQWDRPKIYASL